MTATAPLSRHLPTEPGLRFGPFVLDLAGGRLLRDGGAVDIPPKPWAVLAFLAARPGVLVSKDELLDGVWGHRHVSDSVLKVTINGLRQVLGEDARAPRWLHTVPRRGYRFSAGAAPEAPEPDHTPAPPPPRGNLPAPGAPLVGRDEALAQLQAALLQRRLVTLTGPGGVGKTRLALAAAGAAPPPDGVWLLRLETWTGDEPLARTLASTLARTLGLSDAAGRDTATLARALAPLRLRLVLDNAEHVADALAPVLADWLQASPGLQVLVTSQRPLRLAGEQVLPLVPLASEPAVALLVQRVQAAAPQWVPDAAALEDLAAIAHGLDGLPLALELAAARVPLLGAAGVRERLGARLQMLTRGASDAPGRHRTLRAALAWSVALLPEPAVRVLERLSVFAGGFTVAAARSVGADALHGADEWAVLDALELLRDMALVVDAEQAPSDAAHPPGPRLRLYDSVRLHAAERLAAHGDEAAAHAAHSAWLCELFGQAQGRLLDASEGDWLAPLEPELENLQAAMGRCLAAATDAAGLRALVELFCVSPMFCFRVGLKHRMLAWLRALRERIEAVGASSLAPELLAQLDAAVTFLAQPSQMLPPTEGLAAVGRALAVGGPWLTPQLRVSLLHQQGQMEVRLDRMTEFAATRQAIAAQLRPDSSLYERRMANWLEALAARDRMDLAAYGAFWARMLAESQQRGDRIEGWRAAWGLGQTLYLQDRLDEAIDTVDFAVDEIRAAGRLFGWGTLLAQGAMLRLARDASPQTLERVREAVQVLRADGMVWWLADALAWAPLWQGRTADALRVQAWADGLLAARGERRGPVFGKLRAAFTERTAGLAPAEGELPVETEALRLALAGPHHAAARV